MKLYLMRHGEALPIGGSISEDNQRPLSPAGQIQVAKVAEGLRRHIHDLKRIVSSPLQRASQTAKILADAWGIQKVEMSPSLAPTSSAAGIHKLLKTYAKNQSLFLVGHHPDVTVLTALLTGLDSSTCPLFGTASVAALEFKTGSKKADFLWFQTSEQLSQP